MKLCIFHSGSAYEAWSVGEGLCDVVRRMGNDVTRVPLVPNMIPGDKPVIKREGFPPFDSLKDFDAVIVSGPEHLFGISPKSKNWLGAIYPEWSKRTFPVLAWMHESVNREDYGMLNVDAIKRTADHIFCPAPQDEEFGFEPLPFGVDTYMFNKGVSIRKPEHQDGQSWCGCGVELTREHHYCWDIDNVRDIPLAFIGLVYDKRKEFLARLTPELAKHNLELKVGNCMVQDLDGINVRRSAKLYADTLRRIKVFLNLPSLSQLVVTKVYEVMACGAMLITQANGAEYPSNTVFYDRADYCATRIVDCGGRNAENIAKLQCEDVHKNHRLELRVEKILAKIQSPVTA